jgi:PAS domain S-box-containing protein
MKDKDKSREQLLAEMKELRRRLELMQTPEPSPAEKERSEISEWITGALDAAESVAFIGAGEDGTIAVFSAGAEKMLGYKAEEVVGKTTPLKFHLPRELEEANKIISKHLGFPVDGFEMFEHAAKLPGFDEGEWTYVCKDGSHLKVHITLRYISNKQGKIIGRLGIARDITEQKRAEEERRHLENQLYQSQKNEAIGTLAGGIAHDFNNILSIIFGYAELAEDDIPEDSPARASLTHIIKAAGRAKDLVHQILTFSRQVEHELKPLRPDPLIKEAVQMLRSTLPTTIRITSKIAKEPGLIMADPSQVHQVFMNLCVNAGHAMKDDGGTLEVSLERVQLDKKDVKGKDLQPGPYLKLTVKDTGCGIPAKDLDRIFDPYFTTRKKEEGTGLGLAVVQGIARKHGGEITVKSKVGKGSTFSVYLPVAPGKEGETGDIQLLEAPHGSAHILFVDDEKGLVESGRLQLEKLGYSVAARTSSVEALEYFKKNHRHVDLLLTDLTMPNMTGWQLADKARKIKPGLHVVLVTGFSESIDDEHLKNFGIDALVMKPFVRKDIAETIRNVLEGIEHTTPSRQ